MVRSRYVSVGGIHTHYLEAGEGSPLVLLHSGEFGASAELTWEYNIEALARRHRVIAPDWLGYGKTDKLKDFVSGSRRMLDHMAAFLDVMALEEADFMGASMGGTMLLREATSNRCRFPIRRMIVCSGGGQVPDSPARHATLDYDGTPEAMRRLLGAIFHNKRFVEDDDYVARRVEASLQPGAWEVIAATRFKAPNIPERRQFGHEDTMQYERIAAPTLIVAGGRDRLRDEGWWRPLEKRIFDCRVEVFPDAGHMVNIEAADGVNSLVEAFLHREE